LIIIGDRKKVPKVWLGELFLYIYEGGVRSVDGNSPNRPACKLECHTSRIFTNMEVVPKAGALDPTLRVTVHVVENSIFGFHGCSFISVHFKI